MFTQSKAILFSIVFSIVSFSLPAYANEIGKIDTARIMSKYKKAIEMGKVLETKKKNLATETASAEKKITEAKAKNIPEPKLQQLLTDLNKSLKSKEAEVSRLQQQTELLLRGEISRVSAVVAKELGMDVVVDNRVVFHGGFDLTDLVIEKLNQ